MEGSVNYFEKLRSEISESGFHIQEYRFGMRLLLLLMLLSTDAFTCTPTLFANSICIKMMVKMRICRQ